MQTISKTFGSKIWENGPWPDEETTEKLVQLINQQVLSDKDNERIIIEIIIFALKRSQVRILKLLWSQKRSANRDVKAEILNSLIDGNAAVIQFLLENKYRFKCLKVRLKEKRVVVSLAQLILCRVPSHLIIAYPYFLTLPGISNPKNFQYITSVDTLKWWQDTWHVQVNPRFLAEAFRIAVGSEAYGYAEYLMNTYPHALQISDQDEWVQGLLNPLAPRCTIVFTLYLMKRNIIKMGQTRYSYPGRRAVVQRIFDQDTLRVMIFRALGVSAQNQEAFDWVLSVLESGYISVAELGLVEHLTNIPEERMFRRDPSERASEISDPWPIVKWFEQRGIYQFPPDELNELYIFFLKRYHRMAEQLANNEIEAVDYLLGRGADVLYEFPLTIDEKNYTSAFQLAVEATHPRSYLINLLLKYEVMTSLATDDIEALYQLLQSISVLPQQQQFFLDNIKNWQSFDNAKITMLKNLCQSSHNEQCLYFLNKCEEQIKNIQDKSSQYNTGPVGFWAQEASISQDRTPVSMLIGSAVPSEQLSL